MEEQPVEEQSVSSTLIVGSVAFDTLHIAGHRHAKVLGGSAVYASLAAAHFAPVHLLGVVGRDFPDSATSMLAERGVDLSGLEIADGETFHWEGRYSEDLSSRETLRTDLNVFADYDPKVPAELRGAQFVLLANIHPGLLLRVLEQLERPRFVVADTMNLWISTTNEALRRLLTRVDLLVLNDEEARQLAGKPNLLECADILRGMGPTTVIIKKGEHGAMLFAPDGLLSLPSWPLATVADPTGAGDTFAGALIGCLARSGAPTGDALRQGVAYGSVLASYCVEGIGTQRLVQASPSDLQGRFQQFRELVRLPGPDL